MIPHKYWNQRVKKSGDKLKTVMKRSLPDVINRYYDNSQKKFISSILNTNDLYLEVGCGYGRLLQLFKDSKNCVGLDFSKEMLSHAKNHVESPIVLASGNKLPFRKDSFEGILCVTVLIHILTYDEVVEVLNGMDDVLKENGILILGEMGYASYYFQKFLSKLGIAKHATALKPSRLKNMIKGMGYSIVQTAKCGIFPMDVYFIVARKDLRHVIDK